MEETAAPKLSAKRPKRKAGTNLPVNFLVGSSLTHHDNARNCCVHGGRFLQAAGSEPAEMSAKQSKVFRAKDFTEAWQCDRLLVRPSPPDRYPCQLMPRWLATGFVR